MPCMIVAPISRFRTSLPVWSYLPPPRPCNLCHHLRCALQLLSFSAMTSGSPKLDQLGKHGGAIRKSQECTRVNTRPCRTKMSERAMCQNWLHSGAPKGHTVDHANKCSTRSHGIDMSTCWFVIGTSLSSAMDLLFFCVRGLIAKCFSFQFKGWSYKHVQKLCIRHQS